MKSRPASARERRVPLGDESTGFPATVTSARICPWPGVSISSAIAAAGSSPPNSGNPRTRLFQTPKWPRSPVREARATRSAAGVDDDELAAPFPQLRKAPGDSARRHQTAVRGQGVRPQHEKKVGPVDVGHREEELVPEHLQRGEHVRELVERGGGEASACPQ